MKVILFGATGMIGQGVLRECLADADVSDVLLVGRRPHGVSHAKVRELVRDDLFAYDDVAASLTGFDACFFCLGVSSAGMTEAAYHRITHDLTMAAATTLAARNPAMCFVFVSGAGTDATEAGRTMWARVKGRTENALQRLPFRAVYLFRPGVIQPLHGIRARTTLYRVTYTVMAPVLPLLRGLLPGLVTTTERVGRAMLAVARDGYPTPVLETRDINAIGG